MHLRLQRYNVPPAVTVVRGLDYSRHATDRKQECTAIDCHGSHARCPKA